MIDADNLVEQVFPGVYKVPDPKNQKKKLLATRNLTPGKVYYGEHTFKTRAQEFRFWDPFRSKLSGAILNGLKSMPIVEGSTCLYLGASTGTTVSHLSDIVGQTGKIFAVEMAPRVARELLENVVRFRKNVIPIVADARHPERYQSVYGKIPVVYCDIAQPDQTEIAITNCEYFFDGKGTLLLVVKASSIDVLKSKGEVFGDQIDLLRKHRYNALERIDLEPYDKNHAIIVAERD
ncbi:MAG: fibrillarin-like rRNA/tRNA 2'-O-methyltransferase [Nitrososphaerales archaeon]